MKQLLKNILKKNIMNIIVKIVFIIIHIYLVTFPSKLLGDIVDLLYNIDSNKSEIIKLVIIMLGTSIVILGCRVIWKNLEFMLQLKINKELIDKLFIKLLTTKLEHINTIKNGEIMAYFVSDIKRVARIITKIISAGTRILVFFIIVGLRIFNGSNIFFTLAVICPIIITIVIILFIKNKVSISVKNAQKSFTELSEFVQESTDSIRTMKAFVGEEKQISEFALKNKKLKKYNLQVSKNQNILDISVSIGFGLSYAIALLFGSILVLEGKTTIGTIVSVISYIVLLEDPVFGIPWLVSKIKTLKNSYGRLDKMFKLEEEIIDFDFENENDYILNNGKKNMSNTNILNVTNKNILNNNMLSISNKNILNKNINNVFKGTIEIRNLNFRYPNSREHALKNINIKINNGDTIGIIGVIGSGKTTLMNLLLRLYDIERDKIYIDKIDINDIEIERIRENICYITQDNFLFSASLKENINLFKDEFEIDEIEKSTKKSMIFDEIQKMEQGIHTIIGEKGVDLSGGQKQRVVISRAFLKTSNIVIFDDTFSALDNRTEQEVLNNIKQLTKNKTCIIISNRVSDIKHCDKILVMDNGEIVEYGNHNQLIENSGIYNEFYQNQIQQDTSDLLS
ncbi:MAG TPA: ABC transporter ATP-binding protein [Clostridia bacterium]|nr:ABC transporter ATP-binding protein [Clostridia bacterium]